MCTKEEFFLVFGKLTDAERRCQDKDGTLFRWKPDSTGLKKFLGIARKLELELSVPKKRYPGWYQTKLALLHFMNDWAKQTGMALW